MLYILSQVLAGIGMAFDLSGKLMKKKKMLLICFTLANLFYVVSYCLLQRPLPAIMNALSLSRGVAYLWMDNKKCKAPFYLIPIFLVTALAFASYAVFNQSIFDLLIVFSTIILAIGLSSKHVFIARLSIVIIMPLWIVYDYFAYGFVNLACDSVNLLFALGAIVVYNLVPYLKSKVKTHDSYKLMRHCLRCKI